MSGMGPWWHRTQGRSDRDRDAELDDIERKEDEILYLLRHRLTTIRIRFRHLHVARPQSTATAPTAPGGTTVAQTDPITLTVGESTVATVVGFDQNGLPFKGTLPTPSWSIDNATFDAIAPDSTNPADEAVTSLAAGVANLTATVAGPAGPLSDTEAITNVAPQVLTSVQVQFKTPTAPAAPVKA